MQASKARCEDRGDLTFPYIYRALKDPCHPKGDKDSRGQG